MHRKANPGGGVAGGAKDSILRFPRDGFLYRLFDDQTEGSVFHIRDGLAVWKHLGPPLG